MTVYKPLNLVQSVLIFGLSAAVFRLCVYDLMPYLQAKGVTDFTAFLISYSIPLTLMMLATIIGLRIENNLPDWKSRLRLKSLSVKTILLCIGFFLISFLLTGLLLPTAKFLASTEWFHAPIYPWTILYLLPTTLTVSIVAQRFQNNWTGFIVHYLGNGILAFLPIAMGVLQ